MHLKDIVTQDLVVVKWTETMEKAYELLTVAGVRHLPVVDEAGGIIGIVSDRDFQRAMYMDQPDFTSGKVARPDFAPTALVRDYMAWPVIAVDESTTIAEAARAMIDHKISSLVLTADGGRVIGIVTTEDMLKTMLTNHEGGVHEARENFTAAVYNSPIGQIAHTLANVGL